MNQNRLESLIEALINVLVGFSINWTANMFVLPLFGFHVTGSQAFGIGLIFTAISIVRNYAIRRWFNAKLKGAANALLTNCCFVQHIARRILSVKRSS